MGDFWRHYLVDDNEMSSSATNELPAGPLAMPNQRYVDGHLDL